MTQEEQYRRDLESSLREVEESTMFNDFAGAQLVNRMNALLQAAFTSNFGVGCSESLATLYTTIGRVAPEMIERSEDLPLLFFSRSFAVVMEEVFRQLQQSRREHTVSSRFTLPHERMVQMEAKSDLRAALTHSPTDSRGSSSQSQRSMDESRPSFSLLRPPSESRLDWRAVSPVSIHSRSAIYAVTEDSGLTGTAAWRREMQRQRPHKILDFSNEALKGRVNIFKVPRSVQEYEVRALLEPFGPILEFYYQKSNDMQYGFALTKLENDTAARQAIFCLDGTVMGGTRIEVMKAVYCAKLRKEWEPSPQGQKMQQQPPLQKPRQLQQQVLQLHQLNTRLQQSQQEQRVELQPMQLRQQLLQQIQLKEQKMQQPLLDNKNDCSEKVAAAAAPIAPVEIVGFATRTEPDSDDESYHSMFSVD